jgi:hypothetical protein
MRAAQVRADILVMNAGLHYMDSIVDTNYTRDLRDLADYITANRLHLPHLVWMETTPQV